MPVRSDHGELRGVAGVGPIRASDVPVHWPEGNVLLARDARSPESRVPDYNTRVSVESASATPDEPSGAPSRPPSRPLTVVLPPPGAAVIDPATDCSA